MIGEITIKIICDEIDDVLGAIGSFKTVTDETAVHVASITFNGKSWELD